MKPQNNCINNFEFFYSLSCSEGFSSILGEFLSDEVSHSALLDRLVYDSSLNGEEEHQQVDICFLPGSFST